jgi:hypothetical protein
MDHVQAQGELQAYLDGALPPEAARNVRTHLEGCTTCRAELALLREVDETLRAWPVLPEPEGLTARIAGQIRKATPEAAPSLWTAPWPWLREHWSEVLLGAALVATILVLVVSARTLAVREAVDLRFWDLQVRRSLAAVEREWYAMRAETGRLSRGSQAGYATQVYFWVAGAIAGAVVLGAGAVGAGVLAQQWRQGRDRGLAGA